MSRAETLNPGDFIGSGKILRHPKAKAAGSNSAHSSSPTPAPSLKVEQIGVLRNRVIASVPRPPADLIGGSARSRQTSSLTGAARLLDGRMSRPARADKKATDPGHRAARGRPLPYPARGRMEVSTRKWVAPASCNKRASGACKRRASAVIEGEVRAGCRCWSQGGDDRGSRAAPLAQDEQRV